MQFLRDCCYKSLLTTKVRCEYPPGIKNIPDDTIKRLSESEVLKVIEVHNEKYNVKMVFCPIVSRAGTDIESVLSRLSANELTIVFVLHHTFDQEYNAPDSSSYERDNLVMVDMLFYEDSGLLKCSKNDEAFRKARNHLKKYAEHKLVVCFRNVLAIGAILGISSIVFKRWIMPRAFAYLNRRSNANFLFQTHLGLGQAKI